jgi:hypothetical protein
MAKRTHLTIRAISLAATALCALGAVLALGPREVSATPPPAPPVVQPATPTPQVPAAPAPAQTSAPPTTAAPAANTASPAAPAAGPSAPATGNAAPAASTTTAQAPAVESTTATIIIGTMPAATATVHWGRKLLGKITPGRPLVVTRPRDSGPLDVMVRAAGFLAVQTRAHTFSDNRVVVKLTPVENKSELLGYRAPLDAGVESPEQAAALNALGATDAGVPPTPVPFQMVPQQPSPLLPLAP